MSIKIKKVISVLLSAVMLFALITAAGITPASASAEDFSYEVDETGSFVTITGYNGSSTNLDIPSEIDNLPVKHIAQYAFLMNDTITSVTIPSSVKTIDRYAFYKCQNLADLTLNEGLKYIGTAAFDCCTSLAKVSIPDTVLYVDNYAFYGCEGLAEINLGKRVGYIGELALGYKTQISNAQLDWETGWTLYDKSNVSINGLTVKGYSNTAAADYASSTSLKNYTDLGVADVNDIGDINGDSDINVKDATLAQKIAVGVLNINDFDLFTADVNDDSAVNGEDVTKLLKYCVQLDTVLGGDSYEAPYEGSDPDQYDLPTMKFYDITDEARANDYKISDVISMNSKSYTSTAKVKLIGFDNLEPEVESYVNVKLQGSSSMGYDKKNFTVKFVKDAQESQKNKMTIVESWGNESKYCLKANYIDHTHARNVVSAKLWGEIVRTRQSVNENIAGLVNCGAIDGFPIKLYINDRYQGLYTFNIPKDGWMLGMESKTVNEAIICGENHSGSCTFQSSYSSGDWSVEYATNENDTAWIETTFNRFQNFVQNSSDEEFRNNISQYTDLDACIDYMLFIHIICGMDCWDKNMLLVTYDGGQTWFPSVYDLDTTWGIHWNGQSFYTDDEMSEISSRSPSILWQRLQTVFADEVNARYAELREGPMSLENIISAFEDFTDPIGNGLYNLDSSSVTGYTGIPQTDCSNVNQIIDNASNRFKTLDVIYGYNG